MSRQIRFITVTLIAILLGVVGCGKKDKISEEYAHLQYIPADTPYAFVSLIPLPEDIQEKFNASYDGLFKVYSRIAGDSYQKYIDRARENTPEGEEIDLDDFWDNKWIQALQKEFEGGFSLNKLNAFGIDKKSVYALYGNGVLPVLRISLSDTDLFVNTIERIEKNAQDEIPELSVADMRLWSLSDNAEEDGQLVFGVSDNDLIVSYLPAGSSDEMLKVLVGKQKPEQSLATSKTISTLMQEKGYQAESLGFIDFQQILNRFIEEPTGLDKEFLAIFEDLAENREEISDTCKTELRAMVDITPRLVYGLTGLSKDNMQVESLFEVRADLAKEMTKLSAPVPGLGEAAGFFSMGFSMNIPEMRDFAIRRIENLKAKPFQCEFLKQDEENLDKMLAAVKNPAAGFVESVHGFNFVLDDINIDAFIKIMELEKDSEEKMDLWEMQEELSENISAYVVFAADKPKTMINMGKMMSPELAELDLKADGEPVLINNLFPEPVPIDIFAAMNDSALAISVGKGAETKSQQAINIKSQEHPPLLAYSIDMNKYMQMFSVIMDMPEFRDEWENEEELTIEEMESVINALFGIAGKTTLSMKLREDGVVFEQAIELK